MVAPALETELLLRSVVIPRRYAGGSKYDYRENINPNVMILQPL